MGAFTVYPAIDLRQGRVVRLAQGDPDRETAYDPDPLRVARLWEAAGAQALHVVNLDGAFGEPGAENQRALARILETTLTVQFGGGMRDMAALSRALELGVSRVVVGTAYVEDPGFVGAALDRYGPERVVLGIDALDGMVRIRGWQESAPLQATDLARRWADDGGRWLVFTDISRDGMGHGVNVDTTAALAREAGLNVIASGGVRSLDDVTRVREAGLSGIIIGRALYEGQVDLAEALRTAALRTAALSVSGEE
jgi:phosphoribosylformimino-5-aminoimidazole carboxamide ribotide isomerase